ncbi:helix-turn-helix domain-containing protein [Nonomuraea sp. KM90]|uniref:helix-turn-helix domain-containing protein n=1 Tax=Nonomuraea sp. KM90 TaxID=3457428 RepID=UPI003FCEB4BC
MTAFRNRRLELGLSQMHVAEEIGVAQVTLCSWENGLRTPGLGYFLRLADFLGYEITATPKEDACASNST